MLVSGLLTGSDLAPIVGIAQRPTMAAKVGPDEWQM
jgi:hypothetical protein